MSIYITTSTIKVGAPGVNAASAGEKDLVLSIGQRTGQLLQKGLFTLSDGGSAGRVGSASIGPFDRAPEVIGYARNVGGDAHYPACIVFDNVSLAGPPQLAETFVCNAMTVDSNSISVEGFARTSIGAPEANGFAYVIYRKPNRG